MQNENRTSVWSISGDYALGTFVALDGAGTDTHQHVYVVIGTFMDGDDELGPTGEICSSLAEPTDEERATEAFQAKQREVDAHNAAIDAQRAPRQAQYEAFLKAIEDEGREPSLYEVLFGDEDNDL